MLFPVSRPAPPSKLGQYPDNVNRRLAKEEKLHAEHLESVRQTGYNFLKPPGVKKTMAVLAQESLERSNRSMAHAQSQSQSQSHSGEYDEAFMMQIPDASLNHSRVLDSYRSSFASWQTMDESDAFLPPHTDTPALPRSPVLNFSRVRDVSDQSIYQDSIYIHQDSSFR